MRWHNEYYLKVRSHIFPSTPFSFCEDLQYLTYWSITVRIYVVYHQNTFMTYIWIISEYPTPSRGIKVSSDDKPPSFETTLPSIQDNSFPFMTTRSHSFFLIFQICLLFFYRQSCKIEISYKESINVSTLRAN